MAKNIIANSKETQVANKHAMTCSMVLAVGAPKWNGKAHFTPIRVAVFNKRESVAQQSR